MMATKKIFKDGFGREVKPCGYYYCSFCGNITFHDTKGKCENGVRQ